MKVRCINIFSPYNNEDICWLELNKIYDVLDEDSASYLILDEEDDEVWVSKNRFKIVKFDDNKN